ncbi:MAG: ComEC/Rec2 family competence protein [Phycisphaerae bacterium]
MDERAQPAAPLRRYEPLVPAAAALVAGILAGEYLGGSILLWCLVAGAAAAGWIVLAGRRARPGILFPPLLLVMLAAGAARYRESVDPPPADAARLVSGGSRIATVEGIVVRSPHPGPPPTDVFLPSTPYYLRTKLTLAAERAEVDGRWLPARGGVHVSVRGPMPRQDDHPGEGRPRVPRLGDRVRVTGRMMTPLPRSNPGTFDVATYFRRQGIRVLVSTDHWEAVRVVEPAADGWRAAVGGTGRWAVRRFRAIRSPEGRAVASAVVLGRRDLLRFDTGDAGDIERAFIVTGTAHFLAVSGLAVGLAAGVVLILARLAGLGPKPTAVLVAVVIGAYAMMTELKPPVVRATILVWLLCLAWAAGRERLRLTALAAAVLVILLLRPGDLFTTSFQLSFAVVFGMFYLAAKIDRVLFRRPVDPLADEEPSPGTFRLPSYARRTVTLSLAAALVAVPLAANRFHLVGWLAPVASVLLAPLVFLLVAGSMALVVLGAPVPWLGDLLAAVPDGMARAITGVVSALSRVPGGHFYTSGFSGVWLVVTYGLLAAWVWRERLGVTRRRLAIAVLAAAAVFVWTRGHRAPDGVRATFVAVGSGNTNLLELPNGRTVLYDAGSSLSYARAGEGTTAPVLWWRGVGRVDAAFISHAHFDHFKDVLPLVDRFAIRRVFVPPTFLRRRLSVDDAVVEALLARGVEVTFFGAGDALAGTGRTRVRGLWPRGAVSQTDDVNDGSLVLSVEEGDRRLLLTGDIEPPAIAALMAAELDLRADAILWPHHGHAPDAARALLKHTGARVAVISAARGWNPRPLPSWLADDGVACYHTGRDGTVTVEVGPQGVRARTFRGR